MYIVDFAFDYITLEKKLILLADQMRLQLYNLNEGLFASMDYEDDTAFLEPSLFFYIFGLHNNIELVNPLHFLSSYQRNSESKKIELFSDEDGIIYIPRIGSFCTLPFQKIDFFYDSAREQNIMLYPINKLDLPQTKDFFLKNSGIRIPQEKNQFLISYIKAIFVQSVSDTISMVKNSLFSAWDKLKKSVPYFCFLVEKTTKEISVFNCLNQNSFATLSYFGTAFININGQNANEIFFIDDISHQCGHIIFYALTFNIQEFFLADPMKLLFEYSSIPDTRNIYDVFHGLFTYTTTLNSLIECYKTGDFNIEQKKELIGRVGFYMQKFSIDIKLMADPRIFSNRGIEFYTMFKKSYLTIYNRHHLLFKDFSYQNQPYFYDHQNFISTNMIQ